MTSHLLCKADARNLSFLPDCTVQCCVTSPPFFGLRDYGTGHWVGGDPECDHIAGRGGNLADSAHSVRGGANKMADAQAIPFRDRCGKCGARRVDLQLGLESSPDDYVAAMVGVFREVRRVMRDDATLWLNLGDSYTSGNREGHGTRVGDKQQTNRGMNGTFDPQRVPQPHGLKPKDLVGVPWRVAFALQADGFYLRSDIIWAKLNPMPESVTDRPTKAHEYLFLLTKRERYYYDAEAIKESAVRPGDIQTFGGSKAVNSEIQPGDPRYRGGSEQWGRTIESGLNGRNKWSVWTVATQPFPGAHFATFPPKLIEPCIKAGCPAGGIVLDPFNGSGTTGVVSLGLGRRYIGLDLSAEYLAMARRRIERPHAPVPSLRDKPMPLFDRELS